MLSIVSSGLSERRCVGDVSPGQYVAQVEQCASHTPCRRNIFPTTRARCPARSAHHQSLSSTVPASSHFFCCGTVTPSRASRTSSTTRSGVRTFFYDAGQHGGMRRVQRQAHQPSARGWAFFLATTRHTQMCDCARSRHEERVF